MSRIQSPKGTYDILPANLADLPWQACELWNQVEEILREQCRRWGIGEIRLPIFECSELFYKTTGESSDIVQKERYTFEDKGGRSMTLRPEGTPSALRCLIDANAFQSQGIQKVYYMGPMFRYERPQQGRYRQFHQFGVEVLGPRTPWLDAEVIALGWSILSALGLNQTQLLINTLASEKTRKIYRDKLQEYFQQFVDRLSEDSKRRLTTNPLRILDSKDAGDRLLIEDAPRLNQMLDDESKQFFENVLNLLEQTNIPYKVDECLVRGLDYYCDTVFEFQITGIGAQSAVGGGGRYGRMLADMGGPALEGIGFAFGMERLLQAALQAGGLTFPKSSCDCLIVGISPNSAREAFRLANLARMQGLHIETWPHNDPKKLKQALSYGDKISAKRVAILGDDELQAGRIQIRDMLTRQETTISLDSFLCCLKTKESL